MLNGVRGPAEEMPPEGAVDELEEREDAVRADGGAGGLAVEDEGEQAQAEWIALFIESGGGNR